MKKNKVNKTKRWQLFVLDQDQSIYVLASLPLSSVLKHFKKVDPNEIFINRLIRDSDSDHNGNFITVKELLSLIGKIQDQFESHDFQAPDFFETLENNLKQHSLNDNCYLRKQTDLEEERYLQKVDEENKAFWDQSRPCEYCGKPGKFVASPWGLPCTLVICRWHSLLLFFDSTCYSFLLFILGGLTLSIGFQYPLAFPVFILLLVVKFIPLHNIF